MYPNSWNSEMSFVYQSLRQCVATILSRHLCTVLFQLIKLGPKEANTYMSQNRGSIVPLLGVVKEIQSSSTTWHPRTYTNSFFLWFSSVHSPLASLYSHDSLFIIFTKSFFKENCKIKEPALWRNALCWLVAVIGRAHYFRPPNIWYARCFNFWLGWTGNALRIGPPAMSFYP